MSEFAKLEETIGITFHDPELCREAFTHKSFAAEHDLKYDNQRLELLGDAVVQIILTEELFKCYPALREGDLTKIRSALVNQDSLARFARALELGEHLRLGKGEKEMNGNDRDSTISDLFEALTGAIYLDQGMEIARKFFLGILYRLVPDPAGVLTDLNPKGSLQEFTQHLRKGVPRYKVLSVSGPDHKPVYEVEVSLYGIAPETACAANRKQAECLAAGKLLARLKEEMQNQTKEEPK